MKTHALIHPAKEANASELHAESLCAHYSAGSSGCIRVVNTNEGEGEEEILF